MFENAMKMCAVGLQTAVRRCVALAVAFGFVSALFAAEVTSTDAARAAKAWVDRGYAMGALASERTVSGVDEIEDASTGARLHVVKFEGGGFVVLSADDLVDPVISFSAKGNGVPTDDDNPFWTLLRNDIAAREAAAGVVRGAGKSSGRKIATSRARPASATSTAAQRKWSALLGGGTRLQSVTGDAVSSLSDMRVAPLVQSQWGQDKVGGELCFNFYTPNNYPCGCVATVGAQIMRYFQWPAVSMTMQPFTNPYCEVDGAATSLTTQGGSYDWANMPLNPTAATSPVERQAIGKLTSDIGICCSMSYSVVGSGAGPYMLAEAFTNHFGYGSALAAQWDETVDLSRTETLRRALLSNFDAGLPVVLSLKGVLSESGHAVVGDGYGYSDGSLFIHLNFGWTGISDAWYSPPYISTGDDVVFNFNAINGFIFNILPNLPSSTVICSGRVLDADGNPVAGAVVSYYRSNSTSGGGIQSGNDTGYVMTGSTGIYALRLQPGQYVVSASFGALSTTATVTLSPNVATETACPNTYFRTPASVVNNLCDQDLVLSNLAGVAVPVFDPPSCLFYPTTNVAITCATSGATIRYTLDGTEPTAASAVYTGPITISDDVVITAKAWADGMNPSAFISATYTYDASQGAPKGDYFADPIIISGASGTRVVQDNSAYTMEAGEPWHTPWYQCNTIWYEWTAPGSGQIEFRARFFNTQYYFSPMLAAYTGDSLSSITQITYDDDYDEDGEAILIFQVTQGETYRIVGMSFNDEISGTFTLSWSGDLTVVPTVTPLEITTSVLPPATSGVPYSVTLEATGGVTPYTWSAEALPTGFSLSDNGSTGVLSGTPTTAGIEAVTVFVTDDAGTRVGRTFNLTIEQPIDPLEITTSALPPTTSGVPYSVTLEATGGVEPYTWSAASSGYRESRSVESFSEVGTAVEDWRKDDYCWELGLPFAFPFYGSTYSAVWVNSNGTLTFDGYFAAYTPDRDVLYQHPMIAALWRDLDMGSGYIYVASNSTESVTIRWSGIYYNSTSVSFSATLYADGTIRLCYGDGNANGGMIGISSGNFNTPNCILSSASESGSMNNASDIVFSPQMPLLSELSISPTGALSGTPTASGVESVTVFVTDGAGTRVGKTFNLTIEQPDEPPAPVDPLEITTSVLPPATSGVQYSVTLEAIGGSGSYVWFPPDSYGYDESGSANSFSVSASETAMGWKANFASNDVSWKLDLPFDFPFYEGIYSNVWVSAYGTLTFDEGNRTWYASDGSLSAMKMVAALWENLDTSSGDIYVKSSADAVTVRWSGEYKDDSSPVSFSATLYPDGRIRLSYGAGNANGGLIGVSSGDMGVNYFQASASFSGSMAGAEDIIFTPWTPLIEGLEISTEGEISGTPATAGTNRFHVYVMDIGGTEVMEVGKTLTLTINAPPVVLPSVNSVIACESNGAAVDLAALLNGEKKATYLKAPEQAGLVGETATAYANCFNARADGNNVVIELTAAGTNALLTASTNVAAQVAADLPEVAATTDAMEIAVTGARPGFYYSVVYDDNLRTLGASAGGEGPRALANVNGSVVLPIPQKKANATSGFYRIKVSVRATD